KNCNNLTMLEISLEMDSDNRIELSQFITSLLHRQRGLKHVKFSGYIICYNAWGFPDLSVYSSLLNLLSTQNKSLQKLEFESLSLDNINEKDLDTLCLLKNIRELKLYTVENSYDLKFWATNLTKLRAFEIKHYSCNSIDFIIQLFQSSSNTLVKFIMSSTSWVT